MLVAGFGLGVAIVSVSVAILTGARSEETGMLAGLNSTGHEIGGTLGIAVFTSIAAAISGGIAGPDVASGIADAFLIAATSRPQRASPRSSPSPPRARSCRSCASTRRRADPLSNA
jgi:hypothetical protein